MLLTRNALLLLLLTAPLLAGATVEPVLLYVASVYLLLVLALLLLDWRLTPAAQELQVQRVNDSRLSLGTENLVTVSVENRGRRTVRVMARDEYPERFRADKGVLGASPPPPLRSALRSGEGGRGVRFLLERALSSEEGGKGVRRAVVHPRETLELRYHVRPSRRGDYRFGDTNLRWWGVLGLIVKQARYPTAADVKVFPNLLDIRKYELLVRRGQLEEMGLHQTRVLGSGTQFERLREYQFDDEFRAIDWKATARRGKPISRQFETERSQNIIALLDAGRLMRSPVADPLAAGGDALTKLDYTVNAALMLSYVAGLRGDKVGMLSFADEVTHYLPPRAGRGQFYRMLATLYALDSEPVEADYTRAFAYLRARHKKRSLIVLFTDLASGIAARSVVAQMAPLSAYHLALLVAISEPTVVELAEQTPHDSNTVYQRMVAEQLLDERALTLESLRQRGVLTLDVPANRLTISVVNKYLELKARGRI